MADEPLRLPCGVGVPVEYCERECVMKEVKIALLNLWCVSGFPIGVRNE